VQSLHCLTSVITFDFILTVTTLTVKMTSADLFCFLLFKILFAYADDCNICDIRPFQRLFIALLPVSRFLISMRLFMIFKVSGEGPLLADSQWTTQKAYDSEIARYGLHTFNASLEILSSCWKIWAFVFQRCCD
jgi:hypothetical protein